MYRDYTLVGILSLLIFGCTTLETVKYEASQDQALIVRDGVNSILSKSEKSLVLLKPASRGISSTDNPVFVVGVANLSAEPVTFQVSDITVFQTRNGQAVASLPVKTYEELVRAEKRRQTIAAIGAVLSAAGNSMAAANAGRSTGYGNVYSTTTSPYGTFNTTSRVTATVYDPGKAYLAQAAANAQNQALIDRTVATGQQNLAQLEGTVIKDNTLLPGEWYGGQLHFQKPSKFEGDNGVKTYSISIRVGSDVHHIKTIQSANPS